MEVLSELIFIRCLFGFRGIKGEGTSVMCKALCKVITHYYMSHLIFSLLSKHVIDEENDILRD